MLKSNFKSFEKELQRELDEQKKEQKDTFRKLVFTTFTDVVKRSPVDKGYFRANNLIQSVTPNRATVDSTEGAGKLANDAKVKIDSTRVNDGTTIFITNNLPYADRLENGYSKQAPTGIYKIAEARTRRIVEQLKREVIK